MRADARRNRDRLLAAATATFADHGPDVALEEIARRAGVGVGTLYRHFPDRKALIFAVMEHALTQMVDLARAAREHEPDAWSAIAHYLRGCVRVRAGALMSSMGPALHAEVRRQPGITRARTVLFDTLARTIERAQQDGTLRTDVGVGDIVLLGMMLGRREAELPHGVAEAVPARFVELAIAGLGSVDGPPLPGTPITARDLGAGTVE